MTGVQTCALPIWAKENEGRFYKVHSSGRNNVEIGVAVNVGQWEPEYRRAAWLIFWMIGGVKLQVRINTPIPKTADTYENVEYVSEEVLAFDDYFERELEFARSMARQGNAKAKVKWKRNVRALEVLAQDPNFPRLREGYAEIVKRAFGMATAHEDVHTDTGFYEETFLSHLPAEFRLKG